MTVLLVDDRDSKLRALQLFFADSEYDIAMSVNAAKRKMRTQEYGLMIIDMNLPTFDESSGSGGRNQADGGLTLIRYASMHLPQSKTILFTQYDQLEIDGDLITIADIDHNLRSEFSHCYLGHVHYSTDSDEWIEDLRALTGGYH